MERLLVDRKQPCFQGFASLVEARIWISCGDSPDPIPLAVQETLYRQQELFVDFGLGATGHEIGGVGVRLFDTIVLALYFRVCRDLRIVLDLQGIFAIRWACRGRVVRNEHTGANIP